VQCTSCWKNIATEKNFAKTAWRLHTYTSGFQTNHLSKNNHTTEESKNVSQIITLLKNKLHNDYANCVMREDDKNDSRYLPSSFKNAMIRCEQYKKAQVYAMETIQSKRYTCFTIYSGGNIPQFHEECVRKSSC
jgi:hypothetical protein